MTKNTELAAFYVSAYILLSKHFDFVTRVVFTLLHFWWLAVFAVPVLREIHTISSISVIFGAILTVLASFVGSLLMFFRENSALINALYAVTVVSLLNFIIIAASTPQISSFYLGGLIALGAIAAASHMQYTIKQATCVKTVRRIIEEVESSEPLSPISKTTV